MKEENISRFMRDGKITVLPKKQKNKIEIFEFKGKSHEKITRKICLKSLRCGVS